MVNRNSLALLKGRLLNSPVTVDTAWRDQQEGSAKKSKGKMKWNGNKAKCIGKHGPIKLKSLKGMEKEAYVNCLSFVNKINIF